MKKSSILGILITISVLLVSLITVIAVSAEEIPPVSGSLGENVSWAYDTDTSTLTVSGVGSIPNYTDEDPAPWSAHASTVTSVVIKDGITSVGNNAFRNFTSLADLKLPDSVVDIGDHAFSGSAIKTLVLSDSIASVGEGAFFNCASLTKVTIGAKTTLGSVAFGGCSAVEEYTISEGNTAYKTVLNSLVEVSTKTLIAGTTTSVLSADLDGEVVKIGDYAFANNVSIKSAELPESITSIGAHAFENCSKLTSVTLPEALTEIKEYAFAASAVNTVSIPGSVAEISDYAFFGCTKMASVSFYEGTVRIGSYAFANCTGSAFRSVTLPKGVKYIGDSAFAGSNKITNITLPETVETIGDYAFLDCSKLSAITVYNNTTSIGKGILSGCSAITKISLPFIGPDVNTPHTVGYLFEIDSHDDFAKNIPSTLTSFAITAKDVNTIADYTFYGCKNLTSMDITSDIVNIGASAFSGCSGFVNMVLPGTVEVVGDNAFDGCSGLRNLMMGSNITKIGNYAFRDCSGVKSFTLPDSLTYIGDYAFYGCSLSTKISIASGVEKIGDYAFYMNVALQDLTIADGVKTIGEYAFYGDKAMSALNIPDSVTDINDYAFYECTGIAKLNIGKNLNKLGKYALCGFGSLESIDVDIENQKFQNIGNCLIDKSDLNNCIVILGSNKATFIPVNNRIKEIASYAFYSCSELKELEIPENIVKIGDYAFKDCTALESITIGKNVAQAGFGILSGCSTLENVTVSKDNKVYSSAGNCIIETSSKTVIAGCPKSEIPNDGSVVAISDYAFMGCLGLEELTIPSNITSIGNFSFVGCDDIKVIKLPFVGGGNSSSAFLGYIFGADSYEKNAEFIPSALESVYVIPAKSGYTIAANTFYGCSTVKYIEINSNVTAIELGSFYGCDGITEMVLPFVGSGSAKNAYLGYIFGADKYNTTVRVPAASDEETDVMFVPTSLVKVTITNAEEIYDNAFYGCSSIKEIVVSNKTEKIASKAFSGCSGLESITLPFIGESKTSNRYLGYIFGASSYNKNADAIPASLVTVILTDETSIPDYAFFECKTIKKVVIPESVKSIENKAFIGCESLSNLTVPFIGGGSANNKFFGYIFGAENYSENKDAVPASLQYVTVTNETDIPAYAFYHCPKIYEITIAGTAASVGKLAFNNCGNLTKIVLPETVTSIEDGAFQLCHSLTDITIPETVTKIGNDAFKVCSSLVSITLPNALTSVGNNAFSKCTSLVNVCLGSGITTIGTGAFEGCNELALTEYENAYYLGSEANPYLILIRAKDYSIENCKINENTVFIYDNAFNGCFKLTALDIPSSVKYIGQDVFEYCPLLKVTAPEGLEVKLSTDTTDGTLKRSGCRSAVGSGMIVLSMTMALTGLGFVSKKKKH